MVPFDTFMLVLVEKNLFFASVPIISLHHVSAIDSLFSNSPLPSFFLTSYFNQFVTIFFYYQSVSNKHFSHSLSLSLNPSATCARMSCWKKSNKGGWTTIQQMVEKEDGHTGWKRDTQRKWGQGIRLPSREQIHGWKWIIKRLIIRIQRRFTFLLSVLKKCKIENLIALLVNHWNEIKLSEGVKRHSLNRRSPKTQCVLKTSSTERFRRAQLSIFIVSWALVFWGSSD